MTNGSGLLQTGSPQQLIASYEGLLRRCQQMLVWASAHEWEALIEEESRYVLEVERLTIFSESIPLGEQLHERRMDLVEKILETSLEIQHYLILRRDTLGHILDTALREQAPENSARSSSAADSGSGPER